MLAMTRLAAGHPAPFSYIDARIGPEGIDIRLVAHIFDVSHELRIEPQERLLDPAFLSEQSDAIAVLLGARLQIESDGAPLAPLAWSSATALPDRQAVLISTRMPLSSAPGVVAIRAAMFPYDPAHQTFVNVYERDSLTLQAILGAGKTGLEYFPGSRQGTLAVARRFAPSGARHVLLGPDHLVFLIGLVLLGGSARLLVLLACALATGNAIALTLTALNLLHPPARIIEPALALSIIYVGIDNLMVSGGRDIRAVLALAFGLIHGFWFANGLGAIDLPARTLGWSLLSFDVGVELGQLVVVGAVGLAVSTLRSRNPVGGTRLLSAGSVIVIAAGTYWFIQRVFFPGGWA